VVLADVTADVTVDVTVDAAGEFTVRLYAPGRPARLAGRAGRFDGLARRVGSTSLGRGRSRRPVRLDALARDVRQAARTRTLDGVHDPTAATGRSVARRLAVAVYLPWVLVNLGRGMLVPVVPLYLRDAGMSYTLVTVVVASTGVGAVLAGLPVGRAAQRYGPEWLFAVSAVVTGVMAALIGVSTAVLALVAFHVAGGFGSVGLRIGVQMIVNEAAPIDLRGRAMALVGGGVRLAHFVGPILGGVLVDVVGFAATFAACGVISIVGLAPFVAARREVDGGARFVRPPATAGRLADAVRRHGGLLALAGVGVALVMTVRAGRNVIVPLIGDDLELSATAVGALVAIGTGADLLLFPVSGYLMDRFGRLAAIVPAFSLLGLGMLLLGVRPTVAGAIVAGVVMGVGNGMSAGTMLTLGGDLAPSDPGPFLSALGMTQDVGVIVGPVAVGWLADAAGLRASAIVLAIAMFLAIGWIVVVLGDTARPSRPWLVDRLDASSPFVAHARIAPPSGTLEP
jgi:MFS family permease